MVFNLRVLALKPFYYCLSLSLFLISLLIQLHCPIWVNTPVATFSTSLLMNLRQIEIWAAICVSHLFQNHTTQKMGNVNNVLVKKGREDSDWLKGLSAPGFEACGQIRWENRRTVAVKRGTKLAGRTNFKLWDKPLDRHDTHRDYLHLVWNLHRHVFWDEATWFCKDACPKALLSNSCVFFHLSGQMGRWDTKHLFIISFATTLNRRHWTTTKVCLYFHSNPISYVPACISLSVILFIILARFYRFYYIETKKGSM